MRYLPAAVVVDSYGVTAGSADSSSFARACVFLLGGGPQGFSVRMFVDNDPSHQLAALIERAATRRDVPPAVFEERIEQRFRAVYSLLVVVQVIAYGPAFVAEVTPEEQVGAVVRSFASSPFTKPVMSAGVGRAGWP